MLCRDAVPSIRHLDHDSPRRTLGEVLLVLRVRWRVGIYDIHIRQRLAVCDFALARRRWVCGLSAGLLPLPRCDDLRTVPSGLREWLGKIEHGIALSFGGGNEFIFCIAAGRLGTVSIVRPPGTLPRLDTVGEP